MTEDEFKHDDEIYGRELDRREELEREDIIYADPVYYAPDGWLWSQRPYHSNSDKAALPPDKAWPLDLRVPKEAA